jgi:DNA primase
MDNSQSQEIKNRVDIVEVVRESVPHLKPSGSNWKGLCPFHNEKSPSFMVSQDKQIWHCFGCNEGGDVYTFLMKTQGIEFIDALRQLADRVGIVLEKGDPAVASLRNKALDIHTHARDLFTKELLSDRGKTARDYIKMRGISKELVLELGIGLSPSSWDSLYTNLVKKGFANKEILASGLVLQSDNGKYYDRFRERLMFSLIDAQGQMVGVAGRTLKKDAETAKYINSPQTILYNKSNFLYGFYQAKQSIRTTDLVIIVEGYFDWIALYKNGYTNVVAVSGTALTDDHIQRLKRYTKNFAFALDTDEAGDRALERSVALALSNECTPFILDYQTYKGKEYKDPDELLLTNDKAFKEVIEKKELALAYYIRRGQEELTSSDIQVQKKALSKILPLLQITKNAIDQDHFIKELGSLTGISKEAIREELSKIRATDDVTHPATPQEIAPIQPSYKGEISIREERLHRWIALVLVNTKLFNIPAKEITPEYIEGEDIRTLYAGLLKLFAGGQLPEYKEIQSKLTIPLEIDKWILKTEELSTGLDSDEIETELELLTKKIKEDHLRFVLENLSKKIARAELDKNDPEIKKLVMKHQQLTDSLAQLLQ